MQPGGMQPQAMQQPQVTLVQKPEAANVADPPPLFPPVKRQAPRIERNSDEEKVDENKDRCKCCCIAFCLIGVFVIIVVIVATVMFGGDDEDDSDCFGFSCDTSSSDEYSSYDSYSVSYDSYSVFENDGFMKYYYERCYDLFHDCSGGRSCSIFENRCREFA